MELWTILLVVIVLLVVVAQLLVEMPSARALFMLRHMPGVRGIPIIGAVHILFQTDPSGILDMIEKYSKLYPRRMLVYCGGITSVFLQEPEDLQVVLSSAQHTHKGIEYVPVQPWLGQGLLTSYGEKWRLRRKMLTPTFHFRILENALVTMNKQIDILVENLMKTCGSTVQVDQWISRCTLDIIGESAMGIDLKSQTPEGTAYLNSVKGATQAVIDRILSVWQFQNWLFNLSQNGRNFYKHIKTLHDFTDQAIKERKQKNNSNSSTEEDETGRKVRRAFLDCLLETQRAQPGLLSDLDIREEVDTFMFEGHDTTSVAICFALWLLGTHMEQQDKVYSELKEIFGDEDREMTVQDAAKMNHLEKVIKETLRLYPSVPYIARKLQQDCVLDDGTVLPASTNIPILPYFVHRNERFFPDPEKFDPERFSEENSVGRHPFAFIPFSAGPRNCIGQKFAMLQLKVVLAKILLKLRVEAVTRKDEFKIVPYIVIRPTTPLKLAFSPRRALQAEQHARLT